MILYIVHGLRSREFRLTITMAQHSTEQQSDDEEPHRDTSTKISDNWSRTRLNPLLSRQANHERTGNK